MISAIVLAAGLSSRMGECKTVLPFGKRTVIEHIVHRLFKTGVQDIVVITGHEGDRVVESLEALPVRIVHNFGYEQGGMLSSIKTGLQVVSLGGTRDKNDAGTGRSECEAVLLCLGDQPSLESKVVEQLVGAHKKAGAPEILIPSHKQRAGHPILIPGAFWNQILSLPAGASLRDVTQSRTNPIRYVDVKTDSILRDINTPEEYRKELERARVKKPARRI